VFSGLIEWKSGATMKSIVTLMLAAGLAAGQTNEVHFDVLRTLDGQTISNATVKPMSAAYVIVFFDAGGAKIALTNLPADVQKQFGFDPAKAQAELDLQARQKQEAKDRWEAQMKASQDAERDRLFRIVDDRLVPVASFSSLHGHVSKVMANGVIMLLYERMAQNHRYSGVVTANQSVGAYGGAGGGGVYTTYSDELGDKSVFVKCPVRGIAEGQDWRGLCLHTGTYSNDGQVLEKYDTGVSSVTKSDVVLQEAAPQTPARGRQHN
jgi:hypothetical protein